MYSKLGGIRGFWQGPCGMASLNGNSEGTFPPCLILGLEGDYG